MVAWLEDLAGQAFDRRQALSDAQGGALLYFGETQGLPVESCLALNGHLGAPGGSFVTELDPDASTRCCAQQFVLHMSTS